MNVKAEANFYDEPLVIDKNIFDDKTYNLSDCTFRNGLGYYKFKSLYPENYESLVSFFEENNYKYVFGSDALIFWEGDDLQYLVYASNSSVESVLYNPSQVWVKVVYYNASINASNILDKVFTNTRTKFINPYGGIMFQKIGSNSDKYGYDTKYSNATYGIVIDTNIDIRFDSDYRANLTTSTDKYYHSMAVNGKIYNSGDYINRKAVQHENPKISLKYLTTTGDETGSRIGVTISVDFNIFDSSTRYSYLISFDGGKNWEDYRLSMTSSVFTFSKLENFDAIFQLYDSVLEQSYYTTLKIDNIDMSYRSRWLSFERDDSNDEYTIFNGINYLVSTEFQVLEKFNEVNGYPFDLYYSFDGNNWQRMPHTNTKFMVHSNAPTYFLYREPSSGFRVFQSTYAAACFKETSYLGEIINFDEEQPTDDTFVVYATFVNYVQTHSYWVKEQGEEYQQINPNQSNGMYRWVTTEKKTYCAKITEKNDGSKILQEKCHTVQGLRIVEDMGTYTDAIIDFIDNQRNNLDRISDLIQRMYDGLPVLIKNFFVFSYFLFCMSAIIWNIRK